MKKLLCLVSLGMVACLMSACGSRDRSPVIVCDLDGKVVPTAFTFASFRQTLSAEHGQVEAKGYEQLKTRSVVVSFKHLEDGTLLAERVIALKTGTLMPPAVLFGLKSPVPVVPNPVALADAVATNILAPATATN